MLTNKIKKSIETSVLCWLATSDANGMPNVSPKEIFISWGDQHIIIANIASPRSVKNIRENNLVCTSFIDVLVQKGYKAKGKAVIVGEGHADFQIMKAELEKLTKGNYPFKEVILVEVEKIEPIIAPSYSLFPKVTVQERVDVAKRQYGLV